MSEAREDLKFSEKDRKLYISAIDYMVFGESRNSYFFPPSYFPSSRLLPPPIHYLKHYLYTTGSNHPVIASRINFLKDNP